MAKSWDTCKIKERAVNGCVLHISLDSFLTLVPSLPQSLGGFELRSQKLETAYHWREEKAVELVGKTALPDLRPAPYLS